MKGNIPFFAVKRYHYFKAAVLLCLLCSLVMSACVTNTSTPSSTIAIPTPTIVSSGPCELAPGETFPLSVMGLSGDGVVYRWSAGKGTVEPSDSLAVLYTAPDTGGDDIIWVEARKDGQSSVGEIKCVVSTPVTDAPTDTPTDTPTPKPACISADDIPVKFRILKNNNEIATLSPSETLVLEPGWIVDFEVMITPIGDEPLPEFDYIWENAGKDSGGELLHSNDRMVDYRSEYNDEISMQLSQTDCPALAPYLFFISSKLIVDYEIVPCYKGERKILVNIFPKGANGEYFYTKNPVFEVQIDDTVTLVVTSGDDQVWDDGIHISRQLMRNCISLFKSDNGDGNGNPDDPPTRPY